MEKTVPDWLCTDFLTQCLQHENGKENIVITNFSTSPAIPPGEQYASCPLRVKIEFKRGKETDQVNSLSLIVKSEVTGGAMKEIVESYECCESAFYKMFLPKAHNFTSARFTPKSMFSPKFSIVVLEDLKESGFKMANKVSGLDYDHCTLYVQAAALLHAVSFAVGGEDPELMQRLGREKVFLNGLTGPEGFKAMTVSGMRCLVDYAETSDRFNKYANLIKDVTEPLWDLIIEALEPSPELNTLNHGDPWTNNLMFKYSDVGSVVEIRLLDFQMLRYTSPASDLVFFIWSSANDDVRSGRLDELYHLYVEHFNNNLRQFNCTYTLSYETLISEVRRLSPLAIGMAAFFPPYCAEKAIVDVEPFFRKGNLQTCYDIYKPFFHDEKFWNKRLPKLLEQLESAGVFDYLENMTKSK